MQVVGLQASEWRKAAGAERVKEAEGESAVDQSEDGGERSEVGEAHHNRQQPASFRTFTGVVRVGTYCPIGQLGPLAQKPTR